MIQSSSQLSNTQATSIDQIEAKLQSQKFYDKIEAIERISQHILETQDPIFINSIILKLADFYKNPETTNKLRSHLVKELIAKCHQVLEQQVFNKEEFTTRVSYLLQSNDPQSRMISLKLFSYLPSFIQTRLEIQHKILLLLTTTQNQQERLVANQTITMISRGSEIFAKSIMNKVEETILSGNFSKETCHHFIMAISNISGDAHNAFAFFSTIERLYDNIQKVYGNELDSALIRSLIRMTLKAPIILHKSLRFLSQIECLEGIEIVTRKFEVEWGFIEEMIGQEKLANYDAQQKSLMSQIIINCYIRDSGIEINQILTKVIDNEEVVRAFIDGFGKGEIVKKIEIRQMIILIKVIPEQILENLNQNQLKILYIEVNQMKTSDLKLINSLEQRIDFLQILKPSLVDFKFLFYYCQRYPSNLDQILKSFDLLLDSYAQIDQQVFKKILNNYLSAFLPLVDPKILLDKLALKHLHLEIYYSFIKHLKYNNLEVIVQAIGFLINQLSLRHDSSSNQFKQHQQYLQLCFDYLTFIKTQTTNPFISTDFQLQEVQKLYLQSISILSKYEFMGKEGLEVKDIIHNDGTHDPYKYFYNVQYLALIIQLMELKLTIEVLYTQFQNQEIIDSNDSNQEIRTEIDYIIQTQTEQIKQSVDQIKIAHCIEIDIGNITTTHDIDQIVRKIPTQLFYIQVPLFLSMAIVIEDPNKVQQDEIQVKKDQDFIARIKVKISSQRFIKKIQFAYLKACLILNHGQQFSVQSSDIVFQTQRLIKLNKDKKHETFQLKFPNIGTYVLRLETRIIDNHNKPIGIETFKNIKFRVL